MTNTICGSGLGLGFRTFDEMRLRCNRMTSFVAFYMEIYIVNVVHTERTAYASWANPYLVYVEKWLELNAIGATRKHKVLHLFVLMRPISQQITNNRITYFTIYSSL